MLNHANNRITFVILSLVILIIPAIGTVHAQTANEVDIAIGAGSSAQANCVATNNCFTPNPLTVAPGTTVTWKNTDTTTHVICSGKVTDDQCGSVFEDDALKKGQTFQFTFANAGTFDYYCSVHPWMTGQIIVGASGTVPTPQPNLPTISLTTDRQSYNQGDTIIISGEVSNSVQHVAVTLRIFNSHGDLLSVSQILPFSDGSFTKTILATGPLWADAGTYTITYQQGSLGTPSNQTFYYNGGNGQSTVTPSVPTQPSPTSPLITVGVDKASYNDGDKITISGVVQSVVPGTPVSIEILDPNNNVALIDSVDVTPDEKYVYTTSAAAPYWKLNGSYTVKVQYGPPNVTAQTTFAFITNNQPTSAIYPLQFGGQIYNIPYTIQGGTVISMGFVPTHQSTLEISIITTTDGSITVTLPRSLIDAKTTSGQDVPFITLIDGATVTPQSESANNSFRNITIQYLQGDSKIDITGTQIASGSAPNPTNTSTGIATVTTDKVSYNDGDNITISGTVSNYIANALVGIRIIDPVGNLVKVDQVDLGSDRTFSTSITSTGVLWQKAGTYTVKVQYGGPDTTTTTFQFSGSSGNGQGGNTVKVDGTDLSVKYSITNGQVLDIAANTQSKSLIVSIQTTGDGVLTITLPRTLISATLPTGQDDKYYVLVDGQEADFQETSTTTTDRTLSIPFTDGTKKIDIIGTDLVGNKISSTPSNPYLGCQDCDNIQQTKLTNGGTLNVSFETNPPTPNPGDQTMLKIGFLNKNDNTEQPHIDYKVSVMQGNDQIFGIPVTHVATEGPVSIPMQFQTAGTYQVIVEVQGILFQPIPPETATFSILVTGSQNQTHPPTPIPVPQPLQSTSVFTPTPQDIENINQAKNNQTIAAEINVKNDKTETTSIDNNVTVQTTNTTSDSLGVKVSAASQTGPKVIAFNLNATTINVSNLKDLGVMYDGKLISPAPNMDAILHAKSTDNPSFAIVVTQSGVQVLVLVPHFSTHTITLTNMSKVIPTVPEFGPIVGIITIMSLIGSIIISKKFFISTRVQT